MILNSKPLTRELHDVDIEDYLKKLKQNSYALLYFSYNNKNAPVIDGFEWKFFSVIVIGSRIIAFSPSGMPGAIITRQFIDTAWTNWASINNSKTLIITIAGSTDSTGNIKINVPNSFSMMPYVVTNIRDDLRYPYVVIISGWTQNQINFRIRNASDNAAIINTKLPTFQCMLIGK